MTNRENDKRTPLDWNNQVCLCGNQGWCGRDSHRPLFAIDEDNTTLYFHTDNNGDVVVVREDE